jgi:hypothetical protein
MTRNNNMNITPPPPKHSGIHNKRLWEELSYHEEIKEESPSTPKAKKQNTARRPSPSSTENATTFGLPKQAPPPPPLPFLVVAASRKLAVGDIPKDAIPPPPFVDDGSPGTVIRGELPSGKNSAGSQPPDIFKSRQRIVRDEPSATSSASLVVLGNGRQQLERDLPTLSLTNEKGRPFMTTLSSACKVQPVEASSTTPPSSLTQTMQQQPRQSMMTSGCWMGWILFWWTVLLLALSSMWLCERIEYELKVYQYQQELANCQALDDPFYIHD